MQPTANYDLAINEDYLAGNAKIKISINIPLIHSRRVVVSYKRKYVPELLVNHLFKPAQEKVWLHEGELTVPQ